MGIETIHSTNSNSMYVKGRMFVISDNMNYEHTIKTMDTLLTIRNNLYPKLNKQSKELPGGRHTSAGFYIKDKGSDIQIRTVLIDLLKSRLETGV